MNFTDLDNKILYIAPSLLAADFSNLDNEVINLVDIGIKVLHLDVMDGHFVPNISFGSAIVESLKKYNQNLVFDAHLMVTNPLDYIEAFKKAGCYNITFHLEAVSDKVVEVINTIRQAGLSVGISIKPTTSIQEVMPYLELVDLVLIMTVEPGFGGQTFMDFSDKIACLRKAIIEKKLSTHIQVDGGINKETAKTVRQAGANILVAGTSFFRHPQGQSYAYKELVS